MDVADRRLTPAALRSLRVTKQQLLNEKSAKDGMSPILAAATNSHVDVVRCLAKNNANINDTNPEGQTSLILAAKNGCHSILRLMVHYSASLDIQDNKGRTALMHALTEGYLDLARTLIDAGANQKPTDREGRTALFVAAECGHSSIVEYLLSESSSEFNICDRQGRSVLMMLARAGKAWSVCKYINASQLAAVINARDGLGWTPLLHAAGAGQFALANRLIAWGADITAVTAEGQTVVMLACQVTRLDSTRADADLANISAGSEAWDQMTFISAMLERGVSLDAADKNGRTALFYAVESAQLETLRHLVSLNSGQLRFDTSDFRGCTVLHAAARSGSESIVRYLLSLDEVSSFVNAPNLAGDPPLRLAVMAKSLGTVYALLNSGARLELAESSGHPLLCLAAEFGAVEIVDFLLRKGFNPDTCDAEGASALMTATRYDQSGVVERLLKASANVNQYNNKGFTALVLAVQTSNIAICKSLLNCKANPNLLPEGKTECKTAISIAATLGNCAMIELLLSYDADPILRDPQDRNSLYYCVLRGKAAPLKYLIKWMMCNELDQYYPYEGQKYTLLAIAAERGYIEVASLLLLGRASVEAKTSLGESSMHIACRRQNLRLITDLLTFTFVVNSPRDSDQFTPLMIACQLGNVDIANGLFRRKADPNVRTREGYTALILAATSGSAKTGDRVPIISCLLANGAKFDSDADQKLLSTEDFSLLAALCKSHHVGKSQLPLPKPRCESKSTELQAPNTRASLSGEMTIEQRLKIKLKNKQLLSYATKEQLQPTTQSIKQEAVRSNNISKKIHTSIDTTDVCKLLGKIDAFKRDIEEKLDKVKPSDEKLDEVKPSDVKLDEVKPSDEKLDEVKPSDEKLDKVKPSDEKLDKVKPSDEKLDKVKPSDEKLDKVKPSDEKLDKVKPNEDKLDADFILTRVKNSSDVNATEAFVPENAAMRANARNKRPQLQLQLLYRLKYKTKSAKSSKGLRPVLIRHLSMLKTRTWSSRRALIKWRLPRFWEHARLRGLLKRCLAPRLRWLDEAAKQSDAQLLEKFIVLNLSKLATAVEESKISWAPLPGKPINSGRLCQTPKRKFRRTSTSRLLRQLGSDGSRCSLLLRCGQRSTDVKLAIECDDRNRQIDLCSAIQPVRFESPQFRQLTSEGGRPEAAFKLTVDTSGCLWDPCDLLALSDTLAMQKQNTEATDATDQRRSLDALIGRQSYHLFSLTRPTRPQELSADTGTSDRVALHSALTSKLVGILVHAELSKTDLPYTYHGDDVLCCQQLTKVPTIQRKLTDLLGPDRVKLFSALEFN